MKLKYYIRQRPTLEKSSEEEQNTVERDAVFSFFLNLDPAEILTLLKRAEKQKRTIFKGVWI